MFEDQFKIRFGVRGVGKISLDLKYREPTLTGGLQGGIAVSVSLEGLMTSLPGLSWA